MKIEKGFNDKETIIRISSQEDSSIELWIEQTGLEDSRETLSYLTLDELYQLYKEVKLAGRDLFN